MSPTDPSRASIRMGEMVVRGRGHALHTLLGSCVGLLLYAPRQRIGGLAHIVLPDSRGQTALPGKFVDTAIPGLIAEMERLSESRLRIVAAVVGGASMFSVAASANIGLNNVQACEALLGQLRIPIVVRHCGGETGRRMTFLIDEAMVIIERVGQPTVRFSLDGQPGKAT